MRFAVLALAALAGCNCSDSKTRGQYGEVALVTVVDGATIVARDASLDFGDVVMEHPEKRQVIIRNVGTAPLSLVALRAEGAPSATGGPDDAAVPIFRTEFKAQQLGIGQEITLEVVFRPPLNAVEFVQTHEAVFTLTTGDTKESESQATLHLKGRAINVACEFPEALDFGEVPIGESSRFSLLTKNSTPQEANGSAGVIDSEGADFQAFDYAESSVRGPFTIPPMGSRTITYVFTPTEARIHRARVSLRAAELCPEFEVSLNGKGAAPKVLAISSGPSLTPGIARAGTTLAILFSANKTLNGCAATVGSDVASCGSPTGSSCACTYLVPASLADGEVTVTITVTEGTDQAQATVPLYVDNVPPRIPTDATRQLFIRRHPMGTAEGLEGLRGAALDDGNAVDYPGAGVTRVFLYDTSDARNAPLLTASTALDGTFAETAIPGTTSSAPARLYAVAEDVAGNLSPPTEVHPEHRLNGPPTIDATQVRFARRGIGALDGVSGLAGAALSSCVAIAEIAGDPTSAVLATATPGIDGAYPEQTVGSATASPPQVYVGVSDKCGQSAARVAVADGADVTPPGLDTGAMTIVDQAAPSADRLDGAAGAVVDASGVRSVQLFDAATGGSVLSATAIPAPDGSFSVTATSQLPQQFYVEAVDKAGNAVRASPRGTSLVLKLASPRLQPIEGKVTLFEASLPVHPKDTGFELIAVMGEAALPTTEAAEQLDGTFGITTATPLVGAAQPDWVEQGPHLNSRQGSGAFDEQRGVFVLLRMRPEASFTATETWEWNGASWRRLYTANSPVWSTLARVQLVYDTKAKRVYAVRGDDFAVWAYDGTDWTAVSQSGPRPPTRLSFGLAYHPLLDRVVMHGGAAGGSKYGDTWTWNGSSWTEVANAGGPALGYHQMVWEPLLQRIVLFGGEGSNGLPQDGTWSFDGAVWTALSPTVSAPARDDHLMWYDDATASVRVVGGAGGTGFNAKEVWSFSAGTWALEGTIGQGPSTTATVFGYDPANDRLVFTNLGRTFHLSGLSLSTVVQPPTANPSGGAAASELATGAVVTFGGFSSTYENRLIAYMGDSWKTYSASGQAPSVRAYAGLVSIPDGHELIVFGGGQSGSSYEEGTHRHRSSWSLQPVNALPPGREQHGMAYDLRRRRVLVAGGHQTLPGNTTVRSDSWEFDLKSTWTKHSASGLPPLASVAMAYDPLRNRTVLFGSTGQTFLHDGSSWTEVTTTPAPPPRTKHALAYDPPRGRVLLFGGRATNGTALDDTWEFDGTNWRMLPVPTRPHLGRFGHSFGYCGAKGQMIARGGESADGTYDGRGFWHLESEVSGPRTAGQEFLLGVPDPAPAVLDVTWVGYGSGDPGTGTAANGVELWGWNFSSSSWVLLGQHTADEGAPQAAQTITSRLDPLSQFLRDGRAWVMAAPTFSSSSPPGTVPSVVATDFFEASAP